MKKFLKDIGILGLACFSFLITDNTIEVVKEKDSLMINLRNVAEDYKIAEIDGMVDDKYIKLGLNGLEVDIDKSYQKLKKIGYFNENLLVYKNIEPQISLKKNRNKIIKANSKNEVSLIFKNPTDIDKIIKILDQNDIKATFFIDNTFYNNNLESIELLLSKENNIGFLNDYKILKNKLKEINYYCYSNIVENCNKDNQYSIEATKIVKSFSDLKDNIKGNILEIKDQTYLDIYIKYILSRGYKIVSLEKFISEEIK